MLSFLPRPFMHFLLSFTKRLNLLLLLLLLGETLLALPGDVIRPHPRPEQIRKLHSIIHNIHKWLYG